MVIDNTPTNYQAALEEAIAHSKMSTPLSQSAANNTFFPSSATTPDYGSANAMLAARKQQLAHLQTLQRQQQQVLQQMSARGPAPSPMTAQYAPASPMSAQYGYAQDGRDDRFSASGLRSHPGSPTMGGSQHGGGGSVVSFNGSYANNNPRGASSPRRPAFECDYDTSPTELYLAVQRKDWDGAVERAASSPHEASTWVSRKESDGKLRWRLLPLHAAIIFRAPERTISALLFAFAQGAACKDDQGMLPLHLAFRNGCDEEAIHLLLMAYPQSVDVQDRKGRTPMVLAQQSTHANRDVYIRALERGAAYYAVASAAKDGIVNSPGAGSMVPAMQPTTQQQIQQLTQQLVSAQQSASTLALPALTNGNATGPGDYEHVAKLEAELFKTQETSQVLVDHVNSLEAQLASRSDTERFLATKIANLDSQLKEKNGKLEEAANEIETKKFELVQKDEESGERAQAAEAEVAELKVALADKKEAELKSYRLTNKERFDLEDRVEVSERECASAQANAAVLEAQLKKKIETEQSLASQVSMLASQLASSASSSSEANSAYQRKCESLTTENKKLQSHIAELEGKLGTVATALDAMAAEQERIVDAATKHEKTMASCARGNQAIVLDATRQETLLEDAAKEREQIVSILMRQAEDAERTIVDRERVLEAVKEQEANILTAAQERDAVVDSVNKQREYMDFMLNGELRFLKRTASEDVCDLVNEGKMEAMQNKKNQYLADKPEEEPSPVAADEEDVEEETVAADESAVAVVEEDILSVSVQDESEMAAISDDDEESEDQSAEDDALAAAAEAVKAAMRAAEDVVESPVEDDDSEADAESHTVEISDCEDEDEVEESVQGMLSPVSKKPSGDGGYETPASQEEIDEEADIDAAISAASSDEEDGEAEDPRDEE